MKQIVLFLLCMAAAWAERSGPYLSAGYGLSDFDDDGYNGAGGYTTVVESHPRVWRICGGAYMNEYFSVELDYSDFGAEEVKNGLDERRKNAFSAMSVAAVAHYPAYGGDVDWFAKFGAGEISWEQSGTLQQSDEAGLMLFGAGAGYRMHERMMFKVGYDLFTFKLQTPSQEHDMRLGLLYAGFEVQF